MTGGSSFAGLKGKEGMDMNTTVIAVVVVVVVVVVAVVAAIVRKRSKG